MRILIGSLLFVVLTAIVGLGWTLDRFFDRFATDKVSNEVQAYQQMGAQLAAVLNTTADPRQALSSDSEHPSLLTSIQTRQDFPLPDSMLAEFETGKALVLESDDGVSLHYFLPEHGEVLSITPRDYNASSQSAIKLIFTLVFYIGILALMLLWLDRKSVV